MQLLTTSVKTSYVTLFICQCWSILDQIKYTWSKIGKYYGHIHVLERDEFQEWNLYRPYCTCSFPFLIGCTLLTPNNFLIVLHCPYLYFLKFQQMIMFSWTISLSQPIQDDPDISRAILTHFELPQHISFIGEATFDRSKCRIQLCYWSDFYHCP